MATPYKISMSLYLSISGLILVYHGIGCSCPIFGFTYLIQYLKTLKKSQHQVSLGRMVLLTKFLDTSGDTAKVLTLYKKVLFQACNPSSLVNKRPGES